MTLSTRHRRRTPHSVGLRIPIILLGSVLAFTNTAWATSSPKPGHTFPQAYLDFLAENPELFELKNGWKGKVERARVERELFFLKHRQSSPEQLRKSLDREQALKMAVSGTVQVPVVPILFSPATTPAPPTAARLNQILFTGPNNPFGTVTDYYDEVSYGLLNLTGTVFPYTTVPNDDAHYEGDDNGLPPSGQTGELMEDALDLLDPTVDFGQFDNDGPDGMPNSGDDDGIVDLISFMHPEAGGECGGDHEDNLWAHRFVLSFWLDAPYTTDDAAMGGGFIQIEDYNIQGALNCDEEETDIGTFTHETGHIFGIPDLYDTDNSSQGVGVWSLMAGGNWNRQESPAHMSAWEKAELGWLTPTLLTSTTNELEIPQVATNQVAFQVGLGIGEYFLIANRQRVGFDRFLQTCGLAIWHVDQPVIVGRTPINEVNVFENCGAFVADAGEHYGIALEQADGLCQLEANTSAGGRWRPVPGQQHEPDVHRRHQSGERQLFHRPFLRRGDRDFGLRRRHDRGCRCLSPRHPRRPGGRGLRDRQHR